MGRKSQLVENNKVDVRNGEGLMHLGRLIACQIAMGGDPCGKS